MQTKRSTRAGKFNRFKHSSKGMGSLFKSISLPKKPALRFRQTAYIYAQTPLLLNRIH